MSTQTNPAVVAPLTRKQLSRRYEADSSGSARMMIVVVAAIVILGGGIAALALV